MEQEMFEVVQASSLHVMPAAKHGASGFFPRKRNRKECPSLPYPSGGGGTEIDATFFTSQSHKDVIQKSPTTME
jgi:hypothetical protein